MSFYRGLYGDVVLTCYFTGHPDWQRNIRWNADYSALQKLIDSIPDGVQLVILNDCFPDAKDTAKVKHILVEPIRFSSSLARWYYYHYVLSDNPAISKVWTCDSTDVDMLESPFPHMEEGKLYCGDDEGDLSHIFITHNFRDEMLLDFFKKNANKQMLNAGLLGGSYELMHECIRVLWQVHHARRLQHIDGDKSINVNSDMGIFNYVLYTYYPEDIRYGRRVNTIFKAYDTNPPPGTWWRHK